MGNTKIRDYGAAGVTVATEALGMGLMTLALRRKM